MRYRQEKLGELMETVGRHFLSREKDLSELMVMEECNELRARAQGLSSQDVVRLCAQQLESALPSVSLPTAPAPEAPQNGGAGSPAITEIDSQAGQVHSDGVGRVEGKLQLKQQTLPSQSSKPKAGVEQKLQDDRRVLEILRSKSLPLRTDPSADKTRLVTLANLANVASAEHEEVTSTENLKQAAVDAMLKAKTKVEEGLLPGPPATISNGLPERKLIPTSDGIDANFEAAIRALCGDVERRMPATLQCDVLGGVANLRVRKTFRAGRWNDPAIEDALQAIAQTITAVGRKIAVEVEAGASSSSKSCVTALTGASPSAAKAERTGTSVMLTYIPSLRTGRTLSELVACDGRQAGNHILAFQRAAWSAELLERAAGSSIVVRKVSRMSRSPSTGYDSEWDRLVTIRMRRL